MNLKRLNELQKLLAYKFNNVDLLDEAITHPSYAGESKHAINHNQRLEFYGDTVIEMIVTTKIFELFPEENEGYMTNVRGMLTNRNTLSSLAKHLGMQDFIKMGRGEMSTGGNLKVQALCDVFEALIAAIYIDAGADFVTKFFWRVCAEFGIELEDTSTIVDMFNPKGQLQEYLQKYHSLVPVYTEISVSGPAHDREYTIAVSIADNELARGTGKSIKQATESAARIALRKIKSGVIDSDSHSK